MLSVESVRAAIVPVPRKVTVLADNGLKLTS